jgi:hypothetical protein
MKGLSELFAAAPIPAPFMPAPGVAIAFIPLVGFGSPPEPQVWTVPLKERCQRNVLLATALQVGISGWKMVSGDWYSGLYGGMLGFLGFQTALPNRDRSMLKTYVVISFICGFSGSLEIMQMLLTHTPIFSAALPHAVNYAHLMTICCTASSLNGAKQGWEFILALRRIPDGAGVPVGQAFVQQPMFTTTVNEFYSKLQGPKPLAPTDKTEEGEIVD